MCLWLLTACLGILPSHPSSTIVVQIPAGVPSPILVPTTTSTTTTASSSARPTMPPGPPTMPTGAPTMPSMMPTAAPTMPTAMPTFPSVTGGVLSQVVLCNDPEIVCIINPDDEPDTGSPPIDPRLGTTPAASAALMLPPITGYNAQVPSYDDSAVKFPRQRRGAENYTNISIKEYLLKIQTSKDTEHKIRKRQVSCVCVQTGTCVGGSSYNAAAGMIDIRIVTPGAQQCSVGQVYCCRSTTATPPTTIACGAMQNVPSIAPVTPAAGQANFGEFPWQAVVLTNQNDYIAGGVLINQLNVLTVTHRMVNHVLSGTAPNVKVRLGEWDAAGTYEPVPYQEYNIARVFTHPSYNPNTLQYDLTVLRLATSVPLTPMAGAATTINRACLPPSSASTYVGQRCWAAGWGKNMFGVQGQYQQILKKVDVPIVAPATCQAQLQAARLGTSYALDTTSFVCAGGEANKDSCTGDGGSGLVCQVNGQWILVGLVSWGLGCANTNVPGVYVNVAALLPWIQQQLATPYL